MYFYSIVVALRSSRVSQRMRRGEDMARRCGILDSRTLCKIAGVSMLVSTLLQSMADPDSVKKEENVYLFVPNIIG